MKIMILATFLSVETIFKAITKTKTLL